MSAPVLALSLMTAGAARSQDPHPAVGFRTGFTDGVRIAAAGTFELDTGVSLWRTADATTIRAGEITAHVPFGRRLELRFHLNSYAWARGSGPAQLGREDLGLSARAPVVASAGARPAATLILRLDAPTGTLPGRERSWRPTARLSLGWDLPGKLVLQSNLGYAHGTWGGAPFRRGLASLWLMRRISPPFGAYAEVYGWSRAAPGRGPQTFLHAGVTLRASPGLHLDLHAGTDLAGGSEARWIGVGLRRRT